MTQRTLIQQLRSYTILNMAVFDWAATFICAYLISYYLKYDNWMSVFKIFIILTVIAIVVHKLIGQPTMLNYYLGLNSLNDVLLFRQS